MNDIYDKLRTTLGTKKYFEQDVLEIDILDFIPDGWKSLYRYISRLSQYIPGCYNYCVRLQNGILRCHMTVSDRTNRWIANQIQNKVALLSSQQCMVCGNKGRRRKAENPVVTMCGPHYIEYVNFLDGVRFEYKEEEDLASKERKPSRFKRTSAYVSEVPISQEISNVT